MIGEDIRTPLGVVPIDVELSKKMMEKRKEIQFLPEAHYQEHSLEVQIPFLQVVLKIIQTRSHCDGTLLELGDLPIPRLGDCRDSEREKCLIDCQFRSLPFSLL